MVQLRTMWLAAALGVGLLAVPGCKSQDPAVFLSVNGAYRIPVDADGLRLDVYDADSAKLLVTQTFTLQPGTNFPFTVTVVEDTGGHSSLKLIATATLSTTTPATAVGTGNTTVAVQPGGTVDASIDLVDQ